MTGELSLSGQMWPVAGLDEKLEGAARAGLKKAILPPPDPEEPLPNVPAGVEVVKVQTIFEAINHMVIGEWAGTQWVMSRT
jgi:ATP-dependent Lon protease